MVNKFLEKFGIFDVFSMLIPGIIFIVSVLYLFPHSVDFVPKVILEGGAKYLFFFVLSYLYGVIMHEIGRIFDDTIMPIVVNIIQIILEMVHFNIQIQKGRHKEKFLEEQGNIIKGKLDFVLFNNTKERILQENFLHDIRGITSRDENKFVFNYCMTSLEMQGFVGKAEKMLSISEMSRSLYLSFFILLILYIAYGDTTNILYNCNIAGVVFVGIVFLLRKRRYERFRTDVIMRTYSIYLKNEEDKK